MGPMNVDEGHTAGLLARSLVWDSNAVVSAPKARHQRKHFASESMRWQLASQKGAWAELRAQVSHTHRQRQVPAYNRIVELHGLMGAIGEQAGLCWTIEQDTQRILATSQNRAKEHQTLILRATAESASHFLLGAAHSLGNLGLRLSLLNPRAATSICRSRPKARGFAPGVDDRSAWLTLHDASRLLTAGAGVTSNRHLYRIARSIADLAADNRFIDLDQRRGMDYHRRRPQSVAHTSPRHGSVGGVGSGAVTISMVSADLEPEADAISVYHQLAEAMQPLLRVMGEMRRELPMAIRAEGITYNEQFSLPRGAW